MKVSTLENFSIESVKLQEGVNNKLIIQIKAIHNGLTRNLTHYTAEALKNSLESWTQPYQKKVLKNHDMNSEPLGRILAATYAYDEAAHKDSVMLTAEITDPDAIEKIMDKRYTTVSVGGTSTSVSCSVCKTDIAKEGLCEHYKGEFYDGQMAYWMVNHFEPDEVSFVNAPADTHAGISDIYDQDPLGRPPMSAVMNQSAQQTPKLNESAEDGNVKGGQPMELTLEQLQEALAAKEAELATKVEELATKTAEADEANTKLGEANTQVTALTEQVGTLTEQVNTLTTEKATLQESNDTLTTEVGTAKAEKDALETQVVEMRSENHKMLAEKVALAKLFLGRITKEQFDAEVEVLVKRATESLADSLTDLLTEASSVTYVEKLENPTNNSNPTGVKESVEFDSRQNYSNFLSDEISKLFR